MVKAPEKFLDEYLSHEKDIAGKVSAKPPEAKVRSFSEEEITRLKQNLQIVERIYQTPEIKKILLRKHRIHFLDVEGVNVNLSLSYVDGGIMMECEIDMGNKKEFAGARLYQQVVANLSRYIASEKGIERFLKITNPALRVLADNLIQKEFLETEIWDAIAKGVQIRLSTISHFV